MLVSNGKIASNKIFNKQIGAWIYLSSIFFSLWHTYFVINLFYMLCVPFSKSMRDWIFIVIPVNKAIYAHTHCVWLLAQGIIFGSSSPYVWIYLWAAQEGMHAPRNKKCVQFKYLYIREKDANMIIRKFSISMRARFIKKKYCYIFNDIIQSDSYALMLFARLRWAHCWRLARSLI